MALTLGEKCLSLFLDCGQHTSTTTAGWRFYDRRRFRQVNEVLFDAAANGDVGTIRELRLTIVMMIVITMTAPLLVARGAAVTFSAE